METDISDYAPTAIFSIVNKEKKVYPVTFYSYTFTAVDTFTTVELNYDIHNKELLAIFEAFKIWQHYLKGLAFFFH